MERNLYYMTTKDDQINEEEQNSKVEETNEEVVSENTDQNEDSTEVEVEEEVEIDLQTQFDELNRKYLLLYSDFDNFRKRSIKEKAEIISTASGSVIKDVIGTLDDFERAITNNENTEDPVMLKEGFKLIHQKLLNTLVSKGLEPMDAKGEVFNPDKHEAITQIPAPTEEDKGKCVDVVERGYNLKGRALRYAKVVVGQ
jgi:molecular chaperone GrpE